MQVMKFGGASVKDPDAVRNVGEIIRKFSNDKMLVVVSAMDKTTNELEKLAFLARDHQEEETFNQMNKIRRFHLRMIDELFESGADGAVREAADGFFREISQIVNGILLLGEFPHRTYDRIVSYGELLSSTIVAGYLQQHELNAKWLDVRNIIKTDSAYTQAQVVWSVTEENIAKQVVPAFDQYDIIITQGFIASSMEGKITTLGREGSDYTASIFANCLNAGQLVVWKDVKGILNADPRLVRNTVKHESLSYEEAVEMTFYGATVIHPKTIKPLFLKRIPLRVKCFLDVNETGTEINAAENFVGRGIIPSAIVKKDQAVIKLKPRDFSFMDERLLDKVFQLISRSNVNVSLIQTSAISLTLCVNDNPEAISQFTSMITDDFEYHIQKGLQLNTIINYEPADWEKAKGAAMVQISENKLYFVK